MRFPPSLLDEIRERLPVSQVVGRRVKLRRQGREFIGLSPFNNEKTPSFTVNDQKGFYHCFSSGQHGDIFVFVMETEGLSFPETVERLAAEAGVAMPAPDPRAAEREEACKGLYEAMEAAAVFFENQLAGSAGRHALDYLEGRGLGQPVRRKFRLGYAPGDRQALRGHLKGLGFEDRVVAEAGLVISGQDIAVPYDRFRDRVIFPIADSRGRVIAFGGRALSADAKAKYLNSPETPLFHKGSVLFNLATARRAAHEAGTVIVAEGYMDVIALDMAGFSNAVAPLGTALTEDQLGLLWRIADEPMLCFDGDAAGLRAAYRAAETAMRRLQPGKSLRFALLPEGQDPDDLIKAKGAGAMAGVLDSALPLIELVWRREFEVASLDTPERRAAFEMRVRGAAAEIANEDVRRHYEQMVRQRLYEFFRGSGPRGQAQKPAPSTDLVRRLGATDARSRREAELVLALVNHPELAQDRAEHLSELDLASKPMQDLRKGLLSALGAGIGDAAEMRTELDRTGHGPALEEAARICGRLRDWWVAKEADNSDVAIAWDHTAALHRKTITLNRELQLAEQALARDLSDDNLARLFELKNEQANAEGTEAHVDGFGAASGRPTRTF